MPKNFDATTDTMVNTFLADECVVANKVWIVLLDENEASIATDDEFDDLTWSTTQKISVTSVTCVDRVIDLGGPHVFTGTTQTPRTLAVLTDDPAGTPQMLAVQNISGGSAYAFASAGDLSVDVLLLRFGYDGEV